MDFQAVEYPNLKAFQNQRTAIIDYAKSKGAIINNWAYVQGVDGKVLCYYNEQLEGFSFNPNIVNIFSTDNLNYFPIHEI